MMIVKFNMVHITAEIPPKRVSGISAYKIQMSTVFATNSFVNVVMVA